MPVELTLELVDLNDIPGILQDEQFEIQVSFRDVDNDTAVVSGFADIIFDTNLLRVDNIVHAPSYDEVLPTGAIDNNLGLVDEVGGFVDLNNPFVLPDDNVVFTLQVTALQDLTLQSTQITTEAGDSDLSEITILGSDGDQRNNTTFGSLTIEPSPVIEIDNSAIEFTTALLGEAEDSLFVRPSLPDDSKSFLISNTGTGLLTISEIRINVPDVSIVGIDGEEDILLNPGQSQEFELSYSPTAADQSFSNSDGIVIVSDAVDTPELSISLAGQSTFNSDINYDGSVNFGDLGPLNVNFGLTSADPNFDPTADINGDGAVNFGDLGPLNVEFGSVLS